MQGLENVPTRPWLVEEEGGYTLPQHPEVCLGYGPTVGRPSLPTVFPEWKMTPFPLGFRHDERGSRDTAAMFVFGLV